MGKTKQKQDRSHYLFSNRELANLIGPLVIEQLLAVFVGMAFLAKGCRDLAGSSCVGRVAG